MEKINFKIKINEIIARIDIPATTKLFLNKIWEESRWYKLSPIKLFKKWPKIGTKIFSLFKYNMAMQIASNPSQFDVVITSNMFGDILSDLLAAVCGSIGILESASIGKSKVGLYEPIHGSAPDIEGLNIANPIATILSAAMMLEISFGLKKEAEEIKKAIEEVLEKGFRTPDLFDKTQNAQIKVGTKEITDKIIEEIRKDWN